MNVPENAGRLTLLEALDIVNASRAQSGPPFPVLLACGFTPLHLATFLHAYLQRSLPARRVHVESGLYGDLIGTLERAAAAAAGTAVVVVIEWADLDRRLGVRHLGGWGTGVRADIIETVQIAADRVGAALEAVARDRHVAVCLPTLSLPPIGHTAGWQAGTFELELQSLITALATRVSRSNGVRIVRRDRLDRLSPIGDRFDVRSELRTGFPYQLHHAAAVAELLAAVIEDRVPKKGLITDLDGTLWSGLIGEVGVDGITWDLDAKSQQHGLYQQFLASLADHGVLIGVASKNDHDLVDKALDRDDLLIERDRIYPVEVSWGAKSAAVERILATWNIGADAVVFVDDSPLELAEVRASHPSIHCLQFESDDPRGVWTLLENLRDLFGKATVSDEDRIRAASLRSGHVAGFGSPATSDDFLSTVQARLTLDFRVDATDARALELVNKTNQFNINGRRYTHAEWGHLWRFRAPCCFASPTRTSSARSGRSPSWEGEKTVIRCAWTRG
jgi:FkbH-like protein